MKTSLMQRFRTWRESRRIKHARRGAPATLDEALARLEAKLRPEDRASILRSTSREFSGAVHFGAGMAMRNEWGLWDDKAPLTQWFRARGIWHADDMSGIITDALHARVHRKPHDFEAAVDHCRRYWARQGLGFGGVETGQI